MLLGLTRSDAVAIHDADDVSGPERIAAQMDHVETHGVAGCGTWCCLIDLNGDPLGYETYPAQPANNLRALDMASIAHARSLFPRDVLD